MSAENADASAEGAQKACHRCKKTFPSESIRPIPPGFKYLAVFALAAAHSGAFLLDAWSQSYCPSCRRWFAAVSLLIAAIAIGAAAFALRWAHQKGFLVTAWSYWTRIFSPN